MFVKQHAVGHLIQLANRHCTPVAGAVVDNLDLNRRIETVFPKFAESLSAALAEDVPLAAQALLNLGRRVVPDLFADHDPAVLAIAATITSAAEGPHPAALEWPAAPVTHRPKVN